MFGIITLLIQGLVKFFIKLIMLQRRNDVSVKWVDSLSKGETEWSTVEYILADA